MKVKFFGGLFFGLMLLAGCGMVSDGTPPELVTRGAVCGDPSIQGARLGTVPGPGACGITDAVEVDAVAGVMLSQPSKMNCRTAKQLNAWTKEAMIPTIGNAGGGIRAVKVAAHYACRNRNNQSGGRLSEHAKGNAIDISEFRLADGTELSVTRDWRASNERGRMIRALHKSACGPFGTVLGPNSDRFHQNHFHFDTASYRNGPFCR